jgi:hypothetical protein
MIVSNRTYETYKSPISPISPIHAIIKDKINCNHYAALSAVATFKDRNFKYLALSIQGLSVCIVRERLKNAPKSRFIRAFLGAENRPLQIVGRLFLHRLQDVRIDILGDRGAGMSHPDRHYFCRYSFKQQ